MIAAAAAPWETFSPLSEVPGVIHGFCGRVPGVDVQADRPAALDRLAAHHAAVREQMGVGDRIFLWGEQVHGCSVATVDAQSAAPIPGVDGLITADPRVCLGVYAADCCAVYLVEPERRVIGLLHSGRKGSELGIVAAALNGMREEFGCDPGAVHVMLSPCIRPPRYEVDFAAMIVASAREAGARMISDCGICTATHLDRYYSYRAERGKTGRMLALLALA